jgi:tetratricopeptide (TPR) repeat protein
MSYWSTRMSSASRLAAAVIALVFGAASLQAQKESNVPARPHLEPGADSNSALANYQHGMRVINDDPQDSYRAFYWATLIDPSSADAWYGRWVARQLIMPSHDFAIAYGYRVTQRAPAQLAVDTLLFRAYALNPFLYHSLLRPFKQGLITARIADQRPTRNEAATNTDVSDRLERKSYEGWILYADQRFEDALKAYANELGNRSTLTMIDTHSARAEIFVHLGNLDSARTEMKQVVALSRLRDRKDRIVIYDSTTMLEREIGAIDERANRKADAKATYNHILEENATFYPAHVRLAGIAIGQGDTATAVSEMFTAVQIEPNDPALRYGYAVMLVDAKRDAEAAEQLRKAIALDPYYAAPYLLMASIADVEEYTEDAAAEYQRYVSFAARSSPDLAYAKGRLATLTSTVATSSSKP